uniref:Uncharacterized protein n=1 Tax=Oryza brachyantha TaxID=4533 RepID=J3N3K3_ORYBR
MAAAAGELGWVAEVAAEELAKLEASHPGRFGPLKAELKRLIADPAWDAAAPLVSPDGAATTTRSSTSSQYSQPAPVLHLVSTQESSSRKRSWGCNGHGEQEEGKRRRMATAAAAPAGKDRAEMAMERAERCLRRIRAFKASLLGFSD